MAETSTIFGFMKYVSATDILSDFKKTVDSHFVNSLRVFRLYSKNSNFLYNCRFFLNDFQSIILLGAYDYLKPYAD